MINFNSPLVAYIAVFVAGLISSASPCVFPVIPLIIGFVGGYAEDNIPQSLLYSFIFSLGLAVTFSILGAISSIFGGMLGDIGGYWKYILSAIAILMGMQMVGILKFNFPNIGLKKTVQKGLIGAFLSGMLFGIAFSPCATPILAVILTYVAEKHNIIYGISLLFVYSLGYMAMIFILGFSAGFAKSILKSQKIQNISNYAHKISGIILILGGIVLLLYMR